MGIFVVAIAVFCASSALSEVNDVVPEELITTGSCTGNAEIDAVLNAAKTADIIGISDSNVYSW